MLKQYWQASLVKAEAARYLAERTDAATADEAFLVGLMQDMVLPLMHQLLPGPYEQFLDIGAVAPGQMCAMEHEQFGMDHGRAAAMLGQTMGLPDSLCEAIRHHHDRPALADVCGTTALAEATFFSGLFPHVCTEWTAPEAAAASEMIQRNLKTESVAEALREIGDRFNRLATTVHLAGTESVDLPALLAEATAEVVQTATSLVGQVHSMMSNTTQVTSQLSAMNVEALRLEEQSQTDALTGVLNRLGLEQTGAQILEQLRDEHQSLTLAFVDLDGFKAVNDRFGHDKGDEALKVVAAALQDVFGPAAMVGRYGGDEFVVLLGGLPDREHADALGHKVLDVIAGAVRDENGEAIPIGLSMGGIWCPVVPETADYRKLLVVADGLMYSAKADDVDSVQIKAVVG